MWNPNQSLNNLYNSCDPRDQLAQDIRQVQSSFQPFQNNGINLGLSPMDPRNQEWQDIQTHLNTQFIYNGF